METSLAMGIGFRHLVEDGLAVLRNEDLPEDRREYVVDDLAEFLQEAMRGLDLERKDSFFVGSADRTAFDTFRFLDQNLRHSSQGDWKEQLPVAKKVFQCLNDGEQVTEDEKRAVASLLCTLLEKVRRHHNLGIPIEPEEIKIA